MSKPLSFLVILFIDFTVGEKKLDGSKLWGNNFSLPSLQKKGERQKLTILLELGV